MLLQRHIPSIVAIRDPRRSGIELGSPVEPAAARIFQLKCESGAATSFRKRLSPHFRPLG